MHLLSPCFPNFSELLTSTFDGLGTIYLVGAPEDLPQQQPDERSRYGMGILLLYWSRDVWVLFVL